MYMSSDLRTDNECDNREWYFLCFLLTVTSTFYLTTCVRRESAHSICSWRCPYISDVALLKVTFVKSNDDVKWPLKNCTPSRVSCSTTAHHVTALICESIERNVPNQFCGKPTSWEMVCKMGECILHNLNWISAQPTHGILLLLLMLNIVFWENICYEMHIMNYKTLL